MKGKVAVLGGADFVMPFSALGFDTFITSDDTEETVASAEKIAEGGYALVVVSENIADLVDDAHQVHVPPLLVRRDHQQRVALARALQVPLDILIP